MKGINIEEIYKSRLKFKYEPPKTRWEEIVAKGKKTYTPDENVAINITDRYYDCDLQRWVEPTKQTGDCIVVTKERAEYLIKNGVAKYE